MTVEELKAIVAGFVQTALADRDNQLVSTRGQNQYCGLWLVGDAAKHWGSDLPCQAVAQDALGNWSCVTEQGQVVQFLGNEVW